MPSPRMAYFKSRMRRARSVPSNTSCSAKPISASSRWFFCFPCLVYGLLRRLLPRDWSLTLIIVFVTIPLGKIAGTAFVQYSQWAARGFADPAAYVLFTAGILPVIGAHPGGPGGRFLPGFFGALLLALGPAQLGLRPCLRAVQHQLRPSGCVGDAAGGLSGRDP
jgi:hypothetical protein